MATYSIEEILNAVYSGTTLSGTASAAEILNTVFDGTDALRISGTGVVPESTEAGQLLQGDGVDGWETTTELTGITINDISNTVHANVVHGYGRNVTGAQIDAGTPIYVSGYNIGADLFEITPADATSDATLPAIGVAEDNIPNGSTGAFVKVGVIENLNTAAWSVGDDLYVAVGGGLTSTKPTGTAKIQKVAQVLRSNVATGVITVFGAGRTNDVPNLSENTIWIGDSNGVPTEMGFEPSTGAGQIPVGDGASGYAPLNSDLSYSGTRLTAPELLLNGQVILNQAANTIRTGGSNNTITFLVYPGGEIRFQDNTAGRILAINSSGVIPWKNILFNGPTTDVAPDSYTVKGASALPAATVNQNGANLSISAGDSATATGDGGNLVLSGGDGTTNDGFVRVSNPEVTNYLDIKFPVAGVPSLYPLGGFLDVISASSDPVLRISNDAAAGSGEFSYLTFKLNTSTIGRSAFVVASRFSDTTDGTRTSEVSFQTADSGSFGDTLVFSGRDANFKGALGLAGQSSDPSDPADGDVAIWVSDGTGAGDAGDIMVKINVGSTVKTITLVDYSAF